MARKHLLSISFFTILFIAVIHYFALDLKWYFTYQWIDIIMHILGGLWIAVTSLWVYLKYKKEEIIAKRQIVFIIFPTIIFLGISWEMFELLSGNTFVHTSNYWSDSIYDTLNGLIGGFIAYFYVIR